MVAAVNKLVLVYCILVSAATWTIGQTHNPCCSFPCQHNGVCMTSGLIESGFQCDCTNTGYYGEHCEIAHWGTWFRSLLKPSPSTTHYLLTHFSWLWATINNVEFLQDFIMTRVYTSRSDPIVIPPPFASGHHYPTLEAYFNRSYYAMSLPPVPEDCPTPFGVAGKKVLPSAELLAERFLRREKFIPDHMNTSLMFANFAQHFTHQFFKTDFKRGAGLTWGRHGVDVSNTYGQGVDRENQLRGFKDGRLKSQTINDEEWPPYLRDANVTMIYPPDIPEDQQFALGHPFFALLPGLFMYNTVFLREHNRVCGVLQKEHPEWNDEQLFQTAKMIIAGETIKIVIEDYVQHLASYNLRLVYKPELLFDQSFQYENRIHVEFNHLYHWHPFNPDVFNIDGKKYTIDEFRFNATPVLEHGMRNFVNAMSNSLAGKMAHHNHGKYTLEVAVDIIKHGRQLRLQSFNNYRRRFDLQPYASFEELTGEKEMAAELQELYGDIEGVDFYLGFLLEKRQFNSPFGQTLIEIGAPYSLKGLLANPISSPSYWKPSTFGGEVGFNIVKTMTLEKLFCLNIKGECPLVSFRVPVEAAREERKKLEAALAQHDEL